jgi:hypothetical protein
MLQLLGLTLIVIIGVLSFSTGVNVLGIISHLKVDTNWGTTVVVVSEGLLRVGGKGWKWPQLWRRDTNLTTMYS